MVLETIVAPSDEIFMIKNVDCTKQILIVVQPYFIACDGSDIAIRGLIMEMLYFNIDQLYNFWERQICHIN